MRQSIRCTALALLSAAAVSFGAQSASAGLLDGGWGGGCGCGTYAYVQSYAATLPYVVETHTVVRRTYMVAPTSYGYGQNYGYEQDAGYGGSGWGWHHRHHRRHFGWHQGY